MLEVSGSRLLPCDDGAALVRPLPAGTRSAPIDIVSWPPESPPRPENFSIVIDDWETASFDEARGELRASGTVPSGLAPGRYAVLVRVAESLLYSNAFTVK